MAAATGRQLLRWLLDALLPRSVDGAGTKAEEEKSKAASSTSTSTSTTTSTTASAARRKGAVERPESEAARLALQNAASSMPSLLAWGRYREAHEELTMVLRAGDEITDLLQVEPEDLRSLLLTPMFLLPQLPAESSEQIMLAFDASALAAWLAHKATMQASLWERFKPLLQELIAAISAAWFFTPGLAAQVLENNRCVLRFAAFLLDMPDPEIDHEVLLSLAFSCINAPEPDKSIMADPHFSRDVIWAFADAAPPPQKSLFGGCLPSSSSSSSAAAAPPLASGAHPSSSSSSSSSAPAPFAVVASRAASEAVAYKLLLECKAPLHTQAGRMSLSAALTLVSTWESKFHNDEAVADVWVSAILTLLPQIYPGGSDACLPAAVLAAFFLPRSSWMRTSWRKHEDDGFSWELQPLWQWFQNLLRQPHSKTRSELVLRGYVASALGPKVIAALTSPSSSAASSSPVMLARLREELSLQVVDATVALVCDVALPISIFEMSTMELQRHLYSPETGYIDAAASCLASILQSLSEKERVARFIDPITALCQRWADRWDCSGPAQGMEPVKGQAAGLLSRFGGATLLLFVASILREVPEWSLFSQRELLQLLRCLAALDHFRDFMEAEHIALCTQLTEMGTKEPGFVDALFAMLQQASSRLPPIGSGERPPQAALRSLHFLLGMVAIEDIAKSASFFAKVWPVLISAFGRSSEGPAWEQEATFLVARAHSVACVAYKSSSHERPTPTKMVEEHLKAGIEALRASPEQQATKAFSAAVAAACRDFAVQRESATLPAATVEGAVQISLFALELLSEAIWSCLQQPARLEAHLQANEQARLLQANANANANSEAAAVDDPAVEGLFEVFIAAARFHDSDGLMEVLYDRCRLGWMLQKHEPLRKKWLAALIGDFAETTRLPLLRRLLDDHPEVAGALGPDPEGDGRRGALAWLGLLRAAL